MTGGAFIPNFTKEDEDEFFSVMNPEQTAAKMRLLDENVSTGGNVLTTLNNYGGATNNTSNTYNMNANVNVSSGSELSSIGQAALYGTQNGLIQNAARLQTMLQGTGQ